MNRTQALRKAIKLFGKNATVKYYGPAWPSSHEARAIARTAFKELREQCKTPELRKEHRKKLDRLQSESLHYRFCIGKIEMGMFNAIKACGDSWEGCFRALTEQPNFGTAHEQPPQLSQAA